jgi:alkylated DNA repair dioxygenase AlkB
VNAGFQASLLDGADEIGPGPLGATVRRVELTAGAWVDLRPGWFSGADVLFDRLVAEVPWRAERRHMYDREVDVPRLLSFYDEAASLPDPALAAAKAALDRHYAAELGEAFRTAGLCYYRDGRDSVAWHGDTIGRGSTHDTMVAILSLGTPRALLLRPRGGGRGATRRYDVGHGDLLVMGGSCQRTWEHAVPRRPARSAPGSASSSDREASDDEPSPGRARV